MLLAHTQFHMPIYTMPPTDTTPDPVLHAHIWIPVDDERLVNWCVSWHPTRPLRAQELEAMQCGLSIHIMDYAPATSDAYGDIRPATQQQNDYLIDWEVQRRRKYYARPGVGAQDQAITESQRPIVDRTQERLGRGAGIIRVRRGCWTRRSPCAIGGAAARHGSGLLPHSSGLRAVAHRGTLGGGESGTTCGVPDLANVAGVGGPQMPTAPAAFRCTSMPGGYQSHGMVAHPHHG